MPEKDFLVVLPNGKSKSYTEEQFNSQQMKDWLSGKEGVQSFERAAYNPEEAPEAADSFTVTMPNGKSRNYSRQDFDRPEMKNWLSQHQDYAVTRLRPAGAWGEQIRKETSHAAVVDKLSGTGEPWMEEGTEWEKSRAIKQELDEMRLQLENFDRKASDELGAISGQQQRYLKQSEQARTRGELQQKIREKEEEYYNSNAVLQNRQYMKDKASMANDELDKMIQPVLDERKERGRRNPVVAGGGYVGELPSYEENLYTAAKNLNEDTIRLYDAPGKYGSEKGFDNFLKGAKDRVSETDFWTMGLTGIVDQFQLKGVLDKVRKELGGMENLTEENINKTLSPMEQQLLAAFFRNADAQASRAEDLSRGYQAGQSAADSMQFMAQFALSGGITAGATKALSGGSVESFSKWIAKLIGKESKSAVRQAVAKGVGAVAESGLNMAFQPGTVKSVLEQQNQFENNNKYGNIVDQKKAVVRGLADYLIENVSERSGEMISKVLGAPVKALGKTNVGKRIADTPFAKWGKAFYDSDQIKLLKAGGWHGYFGEMGEELFGDAIRTVTNVDPDALKRYGEADTWVVLATSFLPMSLFGGAMNTARYGYTKKQYDNQRTQFTEILDNLGFDQTQIDHATDLSRMTSPQSMGEAIGPVIREMAERGASREDLDRAFQFAQTAAAYNIYDAVDKSRADEQRSRALGELQDTYGDFWQNNNGDVRTVERVTLPDGSGGYVLNTDETGLMSVKFDDGHIGFTDAEHNAQTSISTLDQYLDSAILTDRQAREAATMQEEELQARQELASRIAANEPVPMGTAEAPVDGTYVGRDQAGNNIIQTPEGQVALSDNELAEKWGISLIPKTQEQKDADAAAAYEAAQQRKNLYNLITPGEEVVANLEGIDTPVRYNFTRAVFDEETQELQIVVEDQETGEEVILPESAFPGLEQTAAKYENEIDAEVKEQVQEEAIAEGEPAPAPEVPRDFRGNPLPLKQDGSVNQTDLWNKDPEAWAMWNDAQRGDGGANSIGYVQAAASKVKSEIAKAQKQYAKELDFDKREAIEKQIADKQKRLDGLNAILDGYTERARAAKEEAAKAERRAEAEQRERMAPRTPVELAAAYLENLRQTGGLKGSLNREDFARELGWGKDELQKFFPWWAKKGKGKTLIQLAEDMANDFDSQYGIIPMASDADIKDTEVARNALIEVLNSSRTPGDVSSVIPNAREEEKAEEARSIAAAEREAESSQAPEEAVQEDMPSDEEFAAAGLLTDRQGNPINADGSLKLEKIRDVSELSDEDFTNPSRNVMLPLLPKNVDAAIGANGKPVVIKKNIFERNRERHADLTPGQSRQILSGALYNPQLYGQNQKNTKPYYWVVINTVGLNGENRIVLLEVDSSKENVEVVHWHFIDSRGIEKIKRQAEREDGQLLILPSVETEEVGALSDPTRGKSSDSKDSENSENASTSGENINPVVEAVQEAREEVNTNPTDAQKKAGNYKKGHVTIDGYDISIENPKGSVRSGKDASGKEWSVTMNNDYGYIRMTEGVDGDHIDVFLSDNPTEGNVFVIDQVKPDTGEFDEHKVMYGFNSAEEAREAYLANYSPGWKGLGTITEVTKDEFKKWVDSSRRKTKPFAEYKSVKAEGAQNEAAPKPAERTAVPFHPDSLRKAYESGDAKKIKAAEKAMSDYLNSSDSVVLLKNTERGAKNRRQTSKKDSAEYKAQDFIVKAVQKRLKDLDKTLPKVNGMAASKAYDAAYKTYGSRWNASEEDLEQAIAYYESELDAAKAALAATGADLDTETDDIYILSTKHRVKSAETHLNGLRDQLTVKRGELTEAQENVLAYVENKTPEQIREEREEQRQQPLKDRVKEWEDRTGQQIEVVSRKEDVKEADARAAIALGEKPTGWYSPSTGKVVVYLPNIKDVSEIDKTYMHEIVSHKGLRDLLGEERFNGLMDAVWSDLMTEEDRKRWMDYNSHLTGSEQFLHRAAADEFVAHLAENVEANPTAWEKFVEMVREILTKIGIELKISDADLRTLLQASLANYERQQAESRERAMSQAALEAQAAQERREDASAFIEGDRTKAADTAAVEKNPQIPVSQTQEKYEDFGEKIGWARKDLAKKGVKRGAGEGDSRPSWMKKYTAVNIQEMSEQDKAMARRFGMRTDFQEVPMDIMAKGPDFTKPFVGYYTETKKTRGYSRSYKHYITDENRNPIVFTSLEQYESTLPVFEAKDQGYRVAKSGDKYRIVRPASNGKLVEYAEFDTREDAAAYLATPEGCTELLNRKRENYELPALMELTRNNMPDYRNGRNITPEDFQSTFGFRGGEFGNWLNADERQQFLNYAYDSLMDLANILRITPQALSLNGELSIAFGARGRQGAKAHYEPTKAVINLTKMNGAGSLAHEWGHALDNYFGLMDAKQTRNREEDVADNSQYLSSGGSWKRGAREEVRQAFRDVMRAIKQKTVTRSIALDAADEGVEKQRASYDRTAKAYRQQLERGLTKYEYNRKTKQREQVKYTMTPEQMAEYDSLVEQLVSDPTFKWEYNFAKGGFRATGEVGTKLYDLVKDILPNRKEAYGPLNDLFYHVDRLRPQMQRAQEAREGKEETVTVDTDIYKDSKWFDRQRASDYYATDVEMFARALENYVSGEMKAQDQSSDYLTYEKGPLYQKIWDHNPYPAGEEREAVKAAFDKLFDTIDEKTDPQTGKAMLFRKGDWETEGGSVFFRKGRSLVGMHNISESKLRKALKAGGLANPSAAVIDIDRQDHEDYGEISLVMPSALVESSTGTYTGDAWTPTYPGEQKMMGEKGRKSFISDVTDLPNDIINPVEQAYDDYLEDGRVRDALKWWFLDEKGRKPKISYYESSIPADVRDVIRNAAEMTDSQFIEDRETFNAVADLYRQLGNPEEVKRDTTKMEPREGAAEFVKRNIEDRNRKIEEYGINPDSVKRFLRMSENELRKVGRLDNMKTFGDAANTVSEDGLEQEFDKWLEGKDEKYGVESMLFAGWTPSGNKRWVRNSAENASRLMNKEPMQNAYYNNGLSATHAGLLKKMRSLAEIRKHRDLLVTPEEYDEKYKALEDELLAVLEDLSGRQKISDNPFSNFDYAESRLQEALPMRSPVSYLNSEYGYSIPVNGEFAESLERLKKNLRKMPVKYFETKFNRPVTLDEFAAAVVPNDISDETRKTMSDAGLKIFEYDPKAEGSRREATLQATEGEGIRFRKAYHGSGQEFERFDHSHMGEGEGAQAHGWGTYVAFNEETAKGYATRSGRSAGYGERMAIRESIRRLQEQRDERAEANAASAQRQREWLKDHPDASQEDRARHEKFVEMFTKNEDPIYQGIDNAIRQRELLVNSLENAVTYRHADIHTPLDEMEVIADAVWMMNRLSKPNRQTYLDYYRYDAGQLPEGAALKKAYDFVASTTDGDWTSSRNLYEVEIPEDNGLNYLHEQSKAKLTDVAEVWEALSQVAEDDVAVYLNLPEFHDFNHDHTGKSNEYLYQDVARILGSPKEASKLFERIGYAGILYDGYIDGPCAVIFNEGNAQITNHVRFRKVTDKATLDKLNSEPTIKVFRAMQEIDGKLYPPMAAKVDGKFQEPIELGVWEEAVERPELADEKGNFTLNKGNGKSLKARYNPYIHTSRSPLNDQFTSAYDRPNLVTVEVEVPESELTSGYKAEKAKDAVGEMTWHSGPVSGKLPEGKKRKVILSRWDRPVRVVPDSEVAERIAELLDGENISIPYNVVTPSLREELEKRGVQISGEPSGKVRNDIRFRKSNENQKIFISNAEASLDRIKMEKATPEQWIKMLEKEGGLKAGEDKWLGLSDWLKGLDRKTVTKQEVADFIADNRIEIEEEHYGEADLSGLQAEFDEIYDEIIDGASDEVVYDPMEQAWEELNYRHHGGDDFNMAFQLDDRGIIQIEDEDRAGYFLGLKPINSTRLEYTTDGLRNKHEIALTVPGIDPWKSSDEVHFGDAGVGRAIAWARFGDAEIRRENKDLYQARKALNDYIAEMEKKYSPYAYVQGGIMEREKMTNEERAHLSELRDRAAELGSKAKSFDKVLFIDEIQSKRHQEGREKGYRDENIAKKANRREELSRKSYSEEGLTFEEHREFKALQDELYNIGEFNVAENRRAIPAAPFEKNWHELTMKRMLRYAAENGYDYVAWTTGEQQAERYSLDTVVDKVGVNPITKGEHKGERIVQLYLRNSDGDYKNLVVDEDGMIVEGDYSGQKLSAVVGMDLATKIMGVQEGRQEFEGEDLKVGGEGMKGFYDDILPRFMNKYGKKWGVKVEDIFLPNLGADAEAGIAKGLTMHSVKVTPEMKASVMQGQLMFRKIEDRQESESAYDFTSRVNSELSRKYHPLVSSVAVRGDEDGKDGKYDRKKKIITIFAKEKNRLADQIEDTFFHENFHAAVDRMQDKAPFIEEFNRVAKPRFNEDDYAKLREIVEGKYDESEWEEEVGANMFAALLQDGNALFDDMSAGHKRQMDEILNDLKYEPERESKERAPEDNETQVSFDGLRDAEAQEGGTAEGVEADVERRQVGEDSGGEMSPRSIAADLADRYDLQDGEEFPWMSEVELMDLFEETMPYSRETEDLFALIDKYKRLDEADFEEGRRDYSGSEKDEVFEEFLDGLRELSKGQNAIRFRLGEAPVEHGPTAEELIKKVQSFGLRGILNKEDADSFWTFVLQSAPEDTRKEIIDKAFGKDLNIRRQTQQYLADLAMRGYANDESGLLRAAADHLSALIGTDQPLSENDLLYMLWRGARRYSSQDILALASDIAIRRRLGVGEFGGEKFPGQAEAVRDEAAENVEAADEARTEARQEAGRLAKRSPFAAINAAMNAQRNYDRETVDSIVKLAKQMIKEGNISSVNAREMARLMTIIKDANGKRPATVAKCCQQLMDFMVDHTIDVEKELLEKMMKVKTAKVKEPGVDVQAKLDIRAQGIVNAFRGNMGKTETEIREALADIQDKLDSNRTSETRKEELRAEADGLTLALQYATEIGASEAEVQKIRDGIEDSRAEYDSLTEEEKKRFANALKEETAASYDMIRKNKIDRVNAYREMRAALAQAIHEGGERAKSFLEAERERINQIHHEANSDMQGVDDDPIEPKVKGFAGIFNNPVSRFLTNPLANFDQMLRMLGRKHPEGRGYMWKRYMNQLRDANDNEKLGLDAANERLNEKVQEIFDDPTMDWNDIYTLERGMKKVPMKFFNANGQWVEHELTPGNLLYIYMVDKMPDGRMKLRQMGITEENVRDIKRLLDPRFVELADWIQEEFLTDLRDKYNKVHQRVFGTSMAAIENYFPLRILGGVIREEVDLSNPDSNVLPSAMTGSIIKRTVNRKQLDITGTDAFSTVIEHIREMEHWAAFAEVNRDLGTLLSHKRFQNQMKHLNTVYGSGKDLWGKFKKVAVLASGNYHPVHTDLDKAAVNLAKGVTAAKISFRAYTALKQVLSWPAFLADTNPVELAKATSPTNWKKNWEWAMENLPAFKKRVESRKAGNEILEDTELDSKFWGTDFAKWINRNGMAMNAFVDALTVSIGAKAMYETSLKRYLADGYDQEQAEKKAKMDAATLFNETQQSSEKEFLSLMQADRTVASVALSVYRNSSMGYQRQLHQALRTLGRMARKGYKEESIAFMTKQMVRDGLTEEQAAAAAERNYERAGYQAAVRVAVFGWLVQFAWNLGAHAIYLLFGDDPDEKKAMLEEDAMHALLGGTIEGLSGGSVISELLNMKAQGKNFYGYDMNTLPIMSDVQNVLKHWQTDMVAAANELLYLAVQIGIGTNPQTLSDAIVAIVDACNGDMETAKEAMFCILRILNVPQSQLDQLMIDEIGMTARDASKLTYEDIAKRYADYKMMRNAPVTAFAYTDAERKKREKSHKTTFKKKVNERKKLKEEK